ncbi:hypothetical protein MtrunA17_Chr6g0487751 [Medicago truncatula]|uniref:Uncharacterized protein n=1 Tax=Medicago truncatula TaxID=3880 RepID=A0A396HQJ7_MEDTR|nr:hypothetical protein MtrunA17_Chr6g0487751 [Medicago truncatula]
MHSYLTSCFVIHGGYIIFFNKVIYINCFRSCLTSCFLILFNRFS